MALNSNSSANIDSTGVCSNQKDSKNPTASGSSNSNVLSEQQSAQSHAQDVSEPVGSTNGASQ